MNSLNTSPVNQMIEAIANKRANVQLLHCTANIETVIKNAIKREPRLLAFLNSYSITSFQRGSFIRDYSIVLSYREGAPGCINEVEIDDNDWTFQPQIKSDRIKTKIIVTKNIEKIWTQVQASLEKLIPVIEGLSGCGYSTYGFDSLSDIVAMRIEYDYFFPIQQLQELKSLSRFQVKNIWKLILGSNKVEIPKVIYPYLALNYFIKEVIYDEVYEQHQKQDIRDLSYREAINHISYGPLLEKCGVCQGISWAFKCLMDAVGVTCCCVKGELEGKSGGHQWNMIEIKDQFYNIDPTTCIGSKGIVVDEFMQPDYIFEEKHHWNHRLVPEAKGHFYDSYYIQNLIKKNEKQYLNMGLNKQYLYTEIID